ncbi:unnamed protein product, partial [Prorocentrum cordatum]
PVRLARPGLWINTEHAPEALEALGLAAGDLVQVGVLDATWASLGSKIVRVVGVPTLDQEGLFLEFESLGASDAYLEWYARARGESGARADDTLLHVCAVQAKACRATGAAGSAVEHVNLIRLISEQGAKAAPAAHRPGRRRALPALSPHPEIGPTDDEEGGEEVPGVLEELPKPPAEPRRARELLPLLGPRSTGRARAALPMPRGRRAPREDEQPRSRSGGRGGGDPLDEALGGLGRGCADGGRAAVLRQRRGGPGAEDRLPEPQGARSSQGAQTVLAARAAEKAAAGRPSRDRAARSSFERQLCKRLLGRRALTGDRESDGEQVGDSEHEMDTDSRDAKGRHDHFIELAVRKPGLLLKSGLEQLRRQFAGRGPSGELPACCAASLDAVFFLEHGPKAIGAAEVRLLRALARVLGLGLEGQTAQALDVVMQEFTSRALAIKDGGWHAAQWLALVPMDAEPCAASRTAATGAARALQSGAPEPPSRLAAAPTEPPSSEVRRAAAAAVGAGRPAPRRGRGKGGRGRPGGRGAAPPPQPPLAEGDEPERRAAMAEEAAAPRAAGQPSHKELKAQRPRHEKETKRAYSVRMAKLMKQTGAETRTRLEYIAKLIDTCRGGPGSFQVVGDVFRGGRALDHDIELICRGCCEELEWVIICGLNFAAGGRGGGSPAPRPRLVSLAQRAAWGLIGEAVAYCSRGPLAAHEELDWGEVAQAKAVAYNGQEVEQGCPLAQGRLLPGVPAAGLLGPVSALDLEGPRVLKWPLGPATLLKPPSEWPTELPRASAQAASDEEEYCICEHLFRVGIFEQIEEEAIFSIDGAPGRAEALAVVKKGAPATSLSKVTRQIVYIVHQGAYQRIAETDLDSLTPSSSWTGFVLCEGQALSGSSDDQSGAFHLYLLPPQWRGYVAVRKQVPGGCVGWPDSKWVRKSVAAIPMGWLSAVGQPQHLDRRLGDGPRSAGFAESSEWRRDQPLPLLSRKLQQASAQHYLDDFGAPEVAPESVAIMIEDTIGEYPLKQREVWAVPELRAATASAVKALVKPFELPAEALAGLLSAERLLPLGHADARAALGAVVLGTDAGEEGGNLCYTTGLAQHGAQAAA